MTKIAIPIVFLLSIIIAVATFRFIPLGLELAYPDMMHQIINARSFFLAHIIASSIALALGAYQLFPNMRRRFLSLHRWTGRVYVLSVMIGGISGLIIALQQEAIIGSIGFALLAVIWLTTTIRAVLFARAKMIAKHRIWMITSFALTFAAVTLRLQLAFLFFGLDMPYSQIYPFLAWSCWVPNLLFAVWWVKKYPLPPA